MSEESGKPDPQQRAFQGLTAEDADTPAGAWLGRVAWEGAMPDPDGTSCGEFLADL